MSSIMNSQHLKNSRIVYCVVDVGLEGARYILATS